MGFDQLVGHQMGPPPPSSFPPGYLEESRVTAILAGNIAVQAIGTIFFLMRVYSRAFMIGTWKSEDYVLVVSWLCATAYSVCQYGQCANGAGRHIVFVVMQDPNMGITAQKFAYAAQILLFPALSMPKLSICLSYLRIFYNDKKGKPLMQGIAVFIVILAIPFMVETIFSCNPISAYWTEARPPNKCLKDLAGLYINGTLNLLADLTLMAIVTPRILALKLNPRQKYALLGIVFLGVLATIAGVVRMVRVGATIGHVTAFLDPTWDTYDISIWTSTEIYVSLICASAPGVKPVIVAVLPRILGSTIRSRTRTTGLRSKDIELNSSKRKSTRNSTFHKGSMSGWTGSTYAEMGRGTDEESVDVKLEDYVTPPSPDPHQIRRTQHVSIHTSSMPSSPL